MTDTWTTPVPAPRKPLHKRRGCLSAIAVVALLLGLGRWAYVDGYGPQTQREHYSASSTQVKGYLDRAMQATTAATTPALSFDAPTYEVYRQNRYPDGEISNISTVFCRFAVTTRIAPAKVQVLVGQVSTAWQRISLQPVKQSGPDGSTVTELTTTTSDLVTLLLVVEKPPAAADYLTVRVVMTYYDVRYQPAHDYGTPTPASGAPTAATLDDPYWSH
ncbi:hypothetical protein [Kitasatospora viridis]|uniref:Uncharacterized protein n=1 Tax=Kitasatospora viridis TaxID=281105 RepID=A0A561UKC9_9ACTN|nr:hypothetical protein [Kitasatospora viridis]TWF99822.1 hypothetical protein FHX73_113678 [Kitasatospora viridis]